MTYNEWRDELKQNLLCVSDAERRRVLDYYAEAYADRREAGFSEREIISDFGAPYDAAQRILSENKNDIGTETAQPKRTARSAPPPPPRNNGNRPNYVANCPPPDYNTQPNYGSNCPPPNCSANCPPPRSSSDYTWVFVLLCVIFAIPLFSVILSMVIATVAVCTAPICVIGAGAAAMGASVGIFISGEISYGFYTLACGIIALGVGIMLCPLLFKLVILMWKLFKKLFCWIKSLFSGRRFA